MSSPKIVNNFDLIYPCPVLQTLLKILDMSSSALLNKIFQSLASGQQATVIKMFL